MQVPLLLLITLCSTVPSGFGIATWSWEAFVHIEAMFFAMVFIYESLAQLLAVVAPHPVLATLGVLAIWLTDFLFAGAMVRRDDVPWPFRIYAYMSPIGYASRSIVRSDFIHHTFTGAVRNTDGSYSCTDVLQSGCFGITGEEVLESMSQVMYHVSSEDTFWQDLRVLLICAALFKVLFTVMSYYKVCRAKEIGSPCVEEPEV